MSCFIKHKRQKVLSVLEITGLDEQSFIEKFKSMYPKDWERIKNRWLVEEADVAGTSRGLPMQYPDVYMKEMYRNQKGYFGG